MAIGSLASAVAQPINWVQGKWEGTCTRGAKSLNASLLLDSGGGALNRKVISGLKVTKGAITFTEGHKEFIGQFSTDYSSLTGKLGKDEKLASCTMARVFTESDSICLFNDTGDKYFIWLKPASGTGGQAFWLFPTNKLQLQGDRNGTLCWSNVEFPPPTCPRFLPQKTYSCQK